MTSFSYQCPPGFLFHDKYEGSPSCLQRWKDRLGVNNNLKLPLQVAVEAWVNFSSPQELLEIEQENKKKNVK